MTDEPRKSDKVIYEQPLNERIRTLMRLDYLFQSVSASISKTSLWDTRNTLDALLDILDILGRSDVKSELTKEMERILASLKNMATMQNVDTSLLDNVVKSLGDLLSELLAVNSLEFTQPLTDSEMISSLQRRHHITGGKCDFDQPAYHFWLERPIATTSMDLRQWFAPFLPLQEATSLVLNLIRDSATAETLTAELGFLQRSLDAAKPNQMVRVVLDADSPYYPEISGGKHRFSIRFFEYSKFKKPLQTDNDIEFQLICCCL